MKVNFNIVLLHVIVKLFLPKKLFLKKYYKLEDEQNQHKNRKGLYIWKKECH